MASEAGVLPVPEEKIVEKWRLQPGKMLLIDMEEGRIISDEEVKRELAAKHPYREWLDRTQLILEDLKPVAPRALREDVSLLDRQQAFGYTQEDTEDPDGADGDHRARKPSARWAPTRRFRRCRTNRSCSTPISSRTSRRSPTRRSTRSARNW
jgi:hypothetical protein